MVVRLRLQRFGRTHSPFYRIVAADSRAKRDGKFLEVVGVYFLGSQIFVIFVVAHYIYIVPF